MLWDNCGMARTEQSLSKALVGDSRDPRGVLEERARARRRTRRRNQSLEKAGRVADFLEFGELLVLDALQRNESRAAATSARSTRPKTARRLRDDEHFAYVAAWEFNGVDDEPTLHKEQLKFEFVHPSTRSYK